MKKTEKILWGLAILGSLIGLIGLYQRLVGGHTVAAYSTYVPWGLWVAAYAMLIGISVGAFVLASLAYGFGVKALRPLGRVALLTSLAALVGGLFAIWLDLGHPARFLKLFFSTNFKSMMGLMAWFYTIYGILLLVMLYFELKEPDRRAFRWLSIIGLFLVIIFGGAEGALFGVVGAQTLWESGLTPIMFLVEGVLSGMGLVLMLGILLGKMTDDAARWLRWLLVGLIIGVIVIEWAEYSTALYAGIPAKVESLRLILFGDFWWVYWGVHVLLGIVIPLLLLLFAGRNRAALATAGGLIAFSAISTKLNLVIPALVVPELEGLKTAFTGPGLNFSYFPTPTEWLLTIGIVSFAAVVFLALYHWLPRSPVTQEA